VTSIALCFFLVSFIDFYCLSSQKLNTIVNVFSAGFAACLIVEKKRTADDDARSCVFKREWLSIDTKADCCLDEDIFILFLNLPPSPIDRSRLSSYIWLVCLTQIQFRLDSLLISLLNRERKSLFLFPVNTWARDLNSSGFRTTSID
jgi:hypothetical protein